MNEREARMWRGEAGRERGEGGDIMKVRNRGRLREGRPRGESVITAAGVT